MQRHSEVTIQIHNVIGNHWTMSIGYLASPNWRKVDKSIHIIIFAVHGEHVYFDVLESRYWSIKQSSRVVWDFGK